jgi:phage-related protein
MAKTYSTPGLPTLNLTAALLHYGLAIGFAYYYDYLNKKYANEPVNGIETTVRQHELLITAEDVSGATITSEWVSAPQYTFDVKNIQAMIISFFVITGTFHLFYYYTNNDLALDDKGNVTNASFGNTYTQVIHHSNNYFRWIEYSITSTLMLYIIAYSSGVKDIEVYNLIWATNISMIATGQLVETAVRDGGDWYTPMITGFILMIAEFISIFRALQKRFAEINNFIDTHPVLSEGITIPSWLSYLGIIIFIFFSSFGFISLWGAYSGASYESVEYLYIIFSFAAKAILGLFMAYGLSQRQQPRDE